MPNSGEDRGIAGGADPLRETVYACLRAIAQKQMNQERAGHTLTATALVHEAYLRLRDDARIRGADRGSVLHAFAEAMRRILIEHARSNKRLKRGGGAVKVPLEAIRDVADLEQASGGDGESVIAFDDAFGRLEEHEPQVAGVVRLRFFAGLTAPETAAAMGISERTVTNRWIYARAWLARELSRGVHGEAEPPEGGGQRGRDVGPRAAD